MEVATRPDPDQFAPLLEGCLAALADETAAVRGSLAARGLARPLVAVEGRLGEEAGNGFAYEWTLADDSADVRVDDAVQVRCQAGESSGFVIRFERKRRRVSVVTQEWLGSLPGDAELEFDPTWLLAALAERLRDEVLKETYGAEQYYAALEEIYNHRGIKKRGIGRFLSDAQLVESRQRRD